MGVELTSSMSMDLGTAEKNYSARTITPHRREETGLRQRGDGGGVNYHLDVNHLDISCKNFGSRTSTPSTAEDTGPRRRGGGAALMGSRHQLEKLWRCLARGRHCKQTS